MIAAGIDLGGTKIEAQVFAPDWTIADRCRIATPTDYPGLVAAMADAVRWCKGRAGRAVPTGISAAGLLNPATGLALTANLAASGKPFLADIETATDRKLTYVNDCRALILSEAVFGVAQGQSPVAGLIIGSGIGGGVAVDGRLVLGPSNVAGEIGHSAAPAHLVVKHGLPMLPCGCGRLGCIETYISGPGLTRLAKALTGRDLSPPEIAIQRRTDPALAGVWAIWCDLVAELLFSLTLTIDPAVVVLAGGLSRAEGLIPDLTAALSRAQWPGYAIPWLVLAQGGDTSGARGAAYAAYLAIAGDGQ